MRTLADQIRTPRLWFHQGGDLVPILVTLSALWPQERALRILNENYDVLTSLGARQSDREPVTLVLRGMHYSALIDGIEIDPARDGECFYHALLAALGKEDAGAMKRQLGLPDHASEMAVIRALRAHLADYVEANPQLVEPYIAESSPPQVRVAWEESTRGAAPDQMGADDATAKEKRQSEKSQSRYSAVDNAKSFDEAIEAYKKEPHSHLPIWEPSPQRRWLEPLVRLLGMSMPLVQNWAQGRPLLGPLPEPRRNDLAIDDPDRRVYAFMNSAAGRER
ncbi:hypothetical protein ACPUER_36270, partial [Burkholderia sp. DN3021]|uniref:hypothetical protein n=1 Tax=Burkholderia sp. DN3021 TaxID=3410137 RepID=UPI003C7EA0FC